MYIRNYIKKMGSISKDKNTNSWWKVLISHWGPHTCQMGGRRSLLVNLIISQLTLQDPDIEYCTRVNFRIQPVLHGRLQSENFKSSHLDVRLSRYDTMIWNLTLWSMSVSDIAEPDTYFKKKVKRLKGTGEEKRDSFLFRVFLSSLLEIR